MRAFYLFVYFLMWIPVHIAYPMVVKGKKNIPDGPCIICANHSNYIDPFLLIYAFGPKRFLHTMSKKEALQTPVMGWVYKMCGAFPVDRGNMDVNAVRTVVRHIKSGSKVVIFPEGTRTDEDDPDAGKNGAIRFASKLNVPIVPIFITRKKKVFGLVHIHIGEPYDVHCHGHADMAEKTRELMERIFALGADYEH